MSDLRATRPPAPPNGCQTYHGIPGCRCQVRATRGEPHRGAHHCDEHDRYWTDREEMYASMYTEVARKWSALLEHFDLAEDVQPAEVIEVASRLAGNSRPVGPVRIRSGNCRAGDHDECLGMVEQDTPELGITDCLCDCHFPVGDSRPDPTDLVTALDEQMAGDQPDYKGIARLANAALRRVGDSRQSEGLPVGAILASALMAANIPCDSGEDVDRLLDELRQRGYVVAAALKEEPR